MSDPPREPPRRRAAGAAGIDIRVLEDAAEAREAAVLLSNIWAVGPAAAPVSADLIRALAHSGNYAAGAWSGNSLVGASVGFLALEGRRLSLHSHITGVSEALRGAGIGFALKQHQRAWALRRGIEEISWTFDPLIRANARFNLVRVGAVAVAYHRDFYGDMQDGINAGDHSDRCWVSWRLDAPRARARASAASAGPGVEEAVPAGAIRLLAVGPDGGPAPGTRLALDPHRHPLVCQIPADIVAMRGTNPEHARLWRYALRDALGAAMEAGFVAESITPDGWYVLTQPTRGPTAKERSG